MVIKLKRTEWNMSPSEVLTKDVIVKKRIYSLDELEVGDVVSVRRACLPPFLMCLWPLFYHVGVVVRPKESQIQILHFNRDPPPGAVHSQEPSGQKKGYLNVTNFEKFCHPESIQRNSTVTTRKRSRGLYRIVYCKGSISPNLTNKALQITEDDLRHGKRTVLHERAEVDPAESPRLEGLYKFIRNNCEHIAMMAVTGKARSSQSRACYSRLIRYFFLFLLLLLKFLFTGNSLFPLIRNLLRLVSVEDKELAAILLILGITTGLETLLLGIRVVFFTCGKSLICVEKCLVIKTAVIEWFGGVIGSILIFVELFLFRMTDNQSAGYIVLEFAVGFFIVVFLTIVQRLACDCFIRTSIDKQTKKNEATTTADSTDESPLIENEDNSNYDTFSPA